MKVSILAILLLLVLATAVEGGVFVEAADSTTDPFIIVHPIGYIGTGGTLTLSVCAESLFVASATEEAVDIWQTFSAGVQNCQGECGVTEEPPIEGFFDMTSTILHELGHCAFGLGHTTWENSDLELTSFTNTQDADSIVEGADMLRGSLDDVVSPLPGARLVHWFRAADNNPIAIDGTIIDGSTYSRRITDLPAGSSWPANANRIVAESLGESETQTVMYLSINAMMRYRGLTADETNTIRLGMTGLDLLAGTSDDYTINIQYVENCANADIEVQLFDLGTDGPIGGCLKGIEPIPGQGLDVHFTIVPEPVTGQSRVLVFVNSNEMFDAIFADGFESGDATSWTTSTP